MAPDGSGVETVAETWSGQRLNSPNDIVCRSDGLVYFTDPPYGVAPEDRGAPLPGRLRARRPGRRPGSWPTTSRSPTAWPSRPTSGPSTSTTPRGTTCGRSTSSRRATWKPARAGSSRRLDPGKPGGPDGLKVDRDGRVYVAVAQGVWVFEPDGKLLGIIALPKRPANLAWCDRDARTLAITAVDTVYRVRLQVAGIMPPFQPRHA